MDTWHNNTKVLAGVICICKDSVQGIKNLNELPLQPIVFCLMNYSWLHSLLQQNHSTSKSLRCLKDLLSRPLVCVTLSKYVFKLCDKSNGHV